MNIKADAEKYLKYWKEKLKLNDWEFLLEIGDDHESVGGFGSCRISKNNQHCTIQVCEPDKIPADWVGARDVEVTIVHELLHIRLTYCPSSKRDNHHLEFAIETVARILVATRRGISPEDLV